MNRKVNKANPLAISFVEGVNVGVNVEAFVNTPGTPEAPEVFVHNKVFPLVTVTIFGKVNYLSYI